jgi:hypothetical protein
MSKITNFATKMQKILAKTLLLAFTLAVALAPIYNIPTHAAGVTSNVSPSTNLVSTAGTINLTFTPSVTIPAGGTVTVLFPTGYTGTPAYTLNTVAPTSTTTTTLGATSQTQSVLVVAGSLTSGSLVTVAITGMTTPSTAGNYSFLFSSSAGDFGGVLQYIGSANVVNVTAFVPLNLSLVIRDSGDTANTNTCAMGTLSTSSVGSCSYRLKIGTNATSGYTVNVTTSGNFTNGTYNMTNAVAGATGTAIAAGTETYGVKATAGALTSNASGITLATVYGTGASNVVSYVNTSSALLATATSPNAPATSADTTNTILINHKAAIAADTRGGLYTQTATYTVVASF